MKFPSISLKEYTITLAPTLWQNHYFEMLQAPIKGFYTFEHSAHSPLFEEPEKMGHILQEDVLVGVNNLADTKLTPHTHNPHFP